MLSIYLGKMDEAIYYPPAWFDNRYEDEWITEELSFLLLAVALAVSLICFCLYQYKKVPGAVAVVQLVIVLTVCVYSLFMSILCICCMNGYRTEGLTASGSPAAEKAAFYISLDNR